MDFTKQLIAWYTKNKRDLPWRQTRNPYHIWISEIILQQTRIEQGLAYYLRFLDRFPTLADLASAKEQEVLKLWQGLGYYSRARNLHQSARTIVATASGKFPDSYEKIRALKGVGEYTAAAIASISFKHPYPVVDGNVLRFFARYFGVSDPVDKSSGKKKILELAREKMDQNDPGRFNQAIMEFGALQCRPGIPDCLKCPFRKSCWAFIHNKIDALPVKSSIQKVRKRYFHYLVFIHNDKRGKQVVFLRKREENDIWKNLYDFPLVETSGPVSLKKLLDSSGWEILLQLKQQIRPKRSEVYRHILSHQHLHARFYIVHAEEKPVTEFVPVELKRLDDYPLPRLIEKFLSGLNAKW
jgi:A/G-specific adenine glycosylase